mmetsp:Transcript_27290/g.73829  ORF Transcript_27290/g.73829 Transcript_27290/m.73829 type:complete len:249 (+) Transcript_27290:1110-1856(+)
MPEDIHVLDAGVVNLLSLALHQQVLTEAQRHAVGQVELHRVEHDLLEVERQAFAVRDFEMARDELALDCDRTARAALNENLDHALQRRWQLVRAVRAVLEEYHTLAAERCVLKHHIRVGLVRHLELGCLLQRGPLIPHLLRLLQGGVRLLVLLLGLGASVLVLSEGLVGLRLGLGLFLLDRLVAVLDELVPFVVVLPLVRAVATNSAGPCRWCHVFDHRHFFSVVCCQLRHGSRWLCVWQMWHGMIMS